MAIKTTDYTGDDTGDPVEAPAATTETGSGIRDEAALDAAFDAVFGDKDESALDAEATQPVAKSPAQARQQAANQRQQKDELEEEGLVSVNEPDGVEPGTKTEDSADEATEETDEQAETPEGIKTTAPAASAIDPFHKWAALQNGWTPEQITKLEKADPELAAQTLKNVADTYTVLSRQALGNVAPGTAAGTPGAPGQPAPTDAFPTPKLDKIVAGLKEFSENNGEDLANFVTALTEEIVAPYKAMLAAQKVSEQAAQRHEADTTFQAVSKDFPDFYGKDGNRNPVQQERVTGLATLANQIRAGAKAQGKSVSVENCIKQAHAVITAELRATTARKEIVSQVQKRSAQITAKPNGRRNPANLGGKSKQAAAAAFEARVAELGIDFDNID